MKKRIILSFLTLFLAFGVLSAAGVREIGENENIVRVISVDSYANGYSDIHALRRDGTEVVYHVGDESEFEGISLDTVNEGDILVIRDNGIATMSIPPQMFALSVRDITNASSLGFYSADFADPVDYSAAADTASSTLPFDMSDLVQRFSYSYGYLSMDNIMMQGLVVEGAYFARGVLDAIDLRSDLLLSFDDMILVTEEYFDTVFSKGIMGEPGDKVESLESLEALTAPDNLDDEFAYAYGFILTYQIMSQGIELDRTAFPYGMLNRLYNDQALITTDEMNQALNDYISYMNQVIEEWISQMAAENLKKAEDFLAENAKKDGVQIISDLLQIEYTLRNEEDSAMPSEGDTVVVNYTLRDIDGNVIEQNDNASFPLSGVIEGFRSAIMNMHVGDSITAYIHPSIGYGEYGTGAIEPNALLIFDIDLLSIADAE